MAKLGLKPIDEVVRRAIIGDGTAFTELWDSNIESLRKYLKSNIKGIDDFFIDDVCSRSFEKAFRQIRNYDPSKSQFPTWLRHIARNTALDVLESEKRISGNSISLENDPGVENIGDDMATPLEQIVKDEDDENLVVLIEGLPDLYREIARRRMIDGLQYKEIAEELDLELNTVRTRIRRAKAMLDKLKTEE